MERIKVAINGPQHNLMGTFGVQYRDPYSGAWRDDPAFSPSRLEARAVARVAWWAECSNAEFRVVYYSAHA